MGAAFEGVDRLVVNEALALVWTDEELQLWVIRSARTQNGVWLEGRVMPSDDIVFTEVLAQNHSMIHKIPSFIRTFRHGSSLPESRRSFYRKFWT